MGKKRIKAPSINVGSKIRLPETVDHDGKPPIFSLERVQSGDYCFSVLDQESKSQFAEAIFRRRQLTWSQVKNLDRHGLGIEKIARTAIKAGIPKFITEEVDHFLAFRFNGKRPMVGYRLNDVFYVLWFDHNFTLYDH
jgi:hypothetical protein